MRGDERKASDTFVGYLRSVCGLSVADPVPGPNPPDCLMEINSQPFNVEVTNLVEQFPGERSSAVSRIKLEKDVEQLCQRVEDELKAAGSPFGRFVVSNRGDLVRFPRRKRARAVIARKLKNFVEHTRGDEASSAIIFSVRGLELSAIRLPSTDSRITFSPWDFGWEGEVERAAVEQLRARLAAKQPKMAAFKPAILLLIGQYLLADGEIYRRALSIIGDQVFDAIYLVEDRGVSALRPLPGKSRS